MLSLHLHFDEGIIIITQRIGSGADNFKLTAKNLGYFWAFCYFFQKNTFFGALLFVLLVFSDIYFRVIFFLAVT